MAALDSSGELVVHPDSFGRGEGELDVDEGDVDAISVLKAVRGAPDNFGIGFEFFEGHFAFPPLIGFRAGHGRL